MQFLHLLLQVYVKGYLDDEANDKVPFTNSEYLDSITFTHMINDYIQDNVAILSTDNVSKNDTSIIEKLFPDMKLDPEGNKHLRVFIFSLNLLFNLVFTYHRNFYYIA